MGKFGGFPGGNFGGMNMNNLMKQAQKMQEDMLKKQAEVAKKDIEVTSGGGAITVRATGDKVIKEIIIKPEVMDKDDIEMLQDMIVVAVNEALKKADSMMNSELGNFNMPGLF